MDSRTEAHETGPLSEGAQKFAEEKAQYHKEVRQHVIGIVVGIGSCLYELVNPDQAPGPPARVWESLGNKICDFTEFLDEN